MYKVLCPAVKTDPDILCLIGGVGRHIGRVSAEYRLSVGRLSIEYRSTVGRVSVEYQSSIRGQMECVPPPRSFIRAIFRVVFDSRSLFFAPEPHLNACYAGYGTVCQELLAYSSFTKIRT